MKGFGEAAIKYAALDSAAMAFQKLIDNGLTAPDGSPFLRLAEVKYRMGNYEEAQELYSRFLFIENTCSRHCGNETGSRRPDWEIVNGLWKRLKNPVIEAELFAMLDSTTC